MKLLRLLADGAWHSGTDLAAVLGVSRAAVWKQVRAVRELGAPVQAVRGRGYRLPGGHEPLDAAAIRARLSVPASLDRLEVLASVDSTSSYLLRAADSECAACFAEHQTGGRGRRGRGWASPFGANLYFSLACALDPAPPAIGALSPAVGVALARVLHQWGADSVRVKWPNDLIAGGAKLGGILLEHRGEAAGGCRVVIGVGLNVGAAPGSAEGVDRPTARLADLMGDLPERNRLAASLLDAVLRAVVDFRERGFAPFRAAWTDLDAMHGCDVWLENGAGPDSERIAARVTGIAADGALLAEVAGEPRRFYAGELSLRPRR
jgi:BirA family biotin operon repressor/biotin-[acetyl-CoA-carboxylase] ligase